MLKRLTTIATITVAAVATAIVPNLEKQADGTACRRWVDSVYNTLTDRQRVAQLVFPKLMPAQGPGTRAAIKRYVEQEGVGGLLFTAGTLEQYIDMTNYAQSLAHVPLLMTFDGEWGLAMRINGMPKYPCNMALGAVNDTALMYRYGYEMGRQCRLVGEHVNFAPVLDVNSNPNNPVIGYRSFGEDPNRVAALGIAFSRGLEDAGVQSVGKHFPGHGDTSTDSHKEITTVTHDLATLHDVDLVPFREYINSGLSGIMTGHIVVRALDPSGRPASLSHKMTTDLLRDEMGFEGLIYTDALGMKGARMTGHNAAVEALRAGADVLLSSDNPASDIDLIYNMVKRGEIDRGIIEDRCKRILRYKYLLGLPYEKPMQLEGLIERINSPECTAIIDELCNRAITALWNRNATLPVGGLGKKSIAVVSIGNPVDSNFVETCRRYATVDTYRANGAISASLREKIMSHDVVIAAVYSDNAAARTSFGQLTDARSLVGVFMMNPYKMNKFRDVLPKADAVLLAYDNLPQMRTASAMAVFGGIEVSGTLPVELKSTAPLGTGVHIPKSRLGLSTPLAEDMNPSLTDSIDSIVEHALASGAFPGCQVLVARHGNIVIDRCYGNLTAGGAPVTPTTIYDLASVSKATGTLPGVMKAFDLGLIDLDAPASRYIPGLRSTDKAAITVRQLLYHESGMPASLNMYNVMFDTTSYTGRLIAPRRDALHTVKISNGAWGQSVARMRDDIVSRSRSELFPIEAARGLWVGQAAFDTIMGRIYNIPLRRNKRYNYSCLNFCLLMDIEQRVTGQPHDRFVTDSIWAPIGATEMCYRPTLHTSLKNVAPTETDTYLRRQTVHGYVHDETAAMLGGVSGNAGVFGSARDLAKLCQMWLNDGTYGDAQVLTPATVRLFTTAKSPTCRRGLGFDKPDTDNPDKSPTCDEAGAGVFGHLGFTGTVFWVDPYQDLIFIFLCNRVNPTRDNTAFNAANIRPELFRQVYRSLQAAE